MKIRVFVCLLCLCMLLPMCFSSCSESRTVYVYVAQVGDDYVIGDIGGEGTVKVMCDAKEEGFEVFDTLRIQYREADLVAEGGTFTSVVGNPATYDKVLTAVVSVRESRPQWGEPLYG